MKFIFASIILSVALFACGGEAPKKESTGFAKPVKIAKKVDGKKVYKTYCVTCHGLYGDMGASGAHDLTKSKLSLEERVEVITNGRKTMTPFKDLLNEEKIKAVAEYTMELAK